VQQHGRLLIVRALRLALATSWLLLGCHADAPSCHDRVAAMAAHLASPRPLADLHATAAPPVEIVKRLVPALHGCPAAVDIFGSTASLEGGADKRAYLRDKLPPALEACGCAASPDEVGPIVEQLFDVWAEPR
jgi:hypothetical protein